MEEHSKHAKVGLASIKAGMDRKTGRKYLESGKLPSELVVERAYRTRPDPFDEDWPMLKKMLDDASDLEGKALFEWLQEQRPGRYQPGQVRSLQRRIKHWRATEGPDREVFFAQEHRPGEAIQTDFTRGTKLEVTISGEPFEHLICHPVLPYSNWEWVTVCRSESMMALRRGVQAALFQLGRIPQYHQTDNSTAATHDLRTGKRGFNEEYIRFNSHFGMKPRTIGVGKSNQNGDVEASNGVLKRRIKQHLILRGSSDFEDVATYENWLQDIARKANKLRTEKTAQEVRVMRELTVGRVREFKVLKVTVSRESTIRIMRNTYSVASRLIGETLKIHVFDDRLDVFYGGKCQFSLERLLGRNKHRINYRHIIWSMVQKPGAFSRFRYRQEMFPGTVFRRAYDVLCEDLGEGYEADVNYLRILHLAASVSETDTEVALDLFLAAGRVPLADLVKDLVSPREPEVPQMAPLQPDLAQYDDLLQEAVS
jgi:transposase